MEGFKFGLRDLGWLEGENIRFELRAAEGKLHRLPEFAKEIVGAGVDAIAAIGAVTVRAARQATSNIPIVFAVVVEPIADGLAENLQRPGGNVTGVTTFDPEQTGSQLQLLKAVDPGLELETASHHELAIIGRGPASGCSSSGRIARTGQPDSKIASRSVSISNSSPMAAWGHVPTNRPPRRFWSIATASPSL